MYFYERVWWGARGFLDRLFSGKAASAPGRATGEQQDQRQLPEAAPAQTQSAPAAPIIQRVPQTAS